MKTANLLRFPPRITFIPLRAFDATTGAGHTVAVLFRVPVKREQHHASCRDQDSGHQQADHAVAEVDA